METKKYNLLQFMSLLASTGYQINVAESTLLTAYFVEMTARVEQEMIIPFSHGHKFISPKTSDYYTFEAMMKFFYQYIPAHTEK
jgi:hypothetical protein